jgi:Transglycosylase SLT domain
MSFHRFVYLCGWTVVILLAIAGFAAFSADGPTPTDPPTTATPWGQAAGAVSAQGWLSLAGSRATAAIVVAPEETPNPAVTPTRAPATTIIDTGWLGSLQVRQLVESYFGSGDVNRAVRLAWCVSRFDVDAHNPTTGATGLFQIHPGQWSQAVSEMGLSAPDPFDPATNVAVAAHIVYHGDGWTAWDCE